MWNFGYARLGCVNLAALNENWAVPTVLPDQHRMADQQDVSERQLRRHMRRLKEANYTANSGGAPGATLLKKFRPHDAPDDEKRVVYHHQWGGALRMASARLQRHLKTKHDMAIQNWKEQVAGVSGACRWVKQDHPTPWIIKDPRGAITGDRAHVVQELKDFWQGIFGQDPLDLSAFWNLYEMDLLVAHRAPQLPTINCAHILTGARKMAEKAGGPDGLSGKMIALLLQEAHFRAAEMLNLFERRGMWPQLPLLIRWKVVFLPKKRSEAAASLGDTRPICIGPSLYSLWASLRLEQLKSWLASYLDKFQAGGVGGPNVPSLLLTLNLDKHPEAFPVGLCLDYAKAFDSSDIDLSINIYIYIYILNRLRAPYGVVRLLADQWRRHRRWVTLAGCVAETPPLVNT